MQLSKLIKKLQEFPPEMEVAVLTDEENDYFYEHYTITFNVKVADINETNPEILSRIGCGNPYLRLE